jgi:TPR repeat protein
MARWSELVGDFSVLRTRRNQGLSTSTMRDAASELPHRVWREWSALEMLRALATVTLLAYIVTASPATKAQSASAPTSDAVSEQLAAARKARENGDYELAFDLVAPLADIGIPIGQHLLGRLHLSQEFAGYDIYEAFRLMKLSAEQGLPIAQHDLAQMYRTGVGTNADPLSSFSWHLRAARQRFALSERAIAGMYAAGNGVERDEMQAKKWNERANRSDKTSTARRSAPVIAAAKPAAPAPTVQPVTAPPKRSTVDAPVAIKPAATAQADKSAAAKLARQAQEQITAAARKSPTAPTVTAPRVMKASGSAAAVAAQDPKAPRVKAQSERAPDAQARDSRVEVSKVANANATGSGATRSTAAASPRRAMVASRSNYRIQLGAFRNAKIANRIHAEILAALPDDASRRFPVTITAIDKGDGNGLLHRIVAGPVPDLGTAQFICSQILARMPNQGCFSLRTRR